MLCICLRLEAVIGAKPRDARVTARSETLLLKTYGVEVPTPVSDVQSDVDDVSVNVLRKFQPVILEDAYPAKVAADDNVYIVPSPKPSQDMKDSTSYYVFLPCWRF